MEIKSKGFAYELFMMILALIVVVIAILQLIVTLPEEVLKYIYILDEAVYFVFVLDYFTRLLISKNKWDFIKHNKIDLLTIIPFNELFMAFRIFRFLRIAQLLKATKAIRATVFLNNIAKKIHDVLNTNYFYYVILVTAILIFSCAGFVSIFEDIGFKDALWWSFVTATSTGYGDIAPKTDLGRAVAVILMVIGLTFMGILTGTLSTYFLRRDKRINYKDDYKSEVIEEIKTKLDNFDELREEDIKDIFNILSTLKKDNEKT